MKPIKFRADMHTHIEDLCLHRAVNTPQKAPLGDSDGFMPYLSACPTLPLSLPTSPLLHLEGWNLSKPSIGFSGWCKLNFAPVRPMGQHLQPAVLLLTARVILRPWQWHRQEMTPSLIHLLCCSWGSQSHWASVCKWMENYWNTFKLINV